MGWVYGWLEYAIEKAGGKYDVSGTKFGFASQRPYSGLATAFAAAAQHNACTKDIDEAIMHALDEIDQINDIVSPEPIQPSEIQSSWILGRYKGLRGIPLPPIEEFDISVRRKAKKLTQIQLAEQMGVDQAVISRWEQGKTHPNAENLAKLHQILD